MRPRYFRHTDGFDSDACYVRCDTPRRVTVVTREGRERPPHGPWSLAHCLLAVDLGKAIEISEREAAALVTAAMQQAERR